jgi:NDP-sugar pyrophosphorylase family protein
MAFAAMMMAGLDGVENKIDPGQPLDKDIYDLGPEELAKVPSMPGSLEDALDALARDNAFLLKGDVFTEELLSTYIDYKRSKEVDAVRLRPHLSSRCTTTSRDVVGRPSFVVGEARRKPGPFLLNRPQLTRVPRGTTLGGLKREGYAENA